MKPFVGGAFGALRCPCSALRGNEASAAIIAASPTPHLTVMRPSDSMVNTLRIADCGLDWVKSSNPESIRIPQSSIRNPGGSCRGPMGHREDHVQRHQRLQRMRSRFDERAHMFADQPAFADIDQLFRRRSLLRAELVLLRDRVEVLDDSIAQVRAVTDFEQQAVEAVRLGGRMLVELEALVLEFEAAVLLDPLRRRRLTGPMREEAHDA